MDSPQQFEDARLRTIGVLLEEGFGPQLLTQALATLAPGAPWSVRAVPHEPTQREFDLIPPDTIAPTLAWELTRNLQALPGVKDADPTFEARYADEEVSQPDAPAPDLKRRGALGTDALDEEDSDWSVRFVKADKAWANSKSLARKGEGILIGHPDSGYVPHSELGANFRHDLGYDFISGDSDTNNEDGGHGLSTASVISSPHDFDTGAPTTHPFVAGIAPRAQVIPPRVAKRTLKHIPAPIRLLCPSPSTIVSRYSLSSPSS